MKEALNIRAIIQLYMVASSQKVNAIKSKIFFIDTKPKIEKQICHIMGFKKGEFPCNYLGIDLEKARESNKVWKNILVK